MNKVRLGVLEGVFANLLWENEPVHTKKMVQLGREHLNWQRTTTYTVLKKLCERGIFKLENSIVTSLISKPEFHSIQSTQFVQENFGGSLPAFIAAFTSGKTLSKKEQEEIRQLIDSIGE